MKDDPGSNAFFAFVAITLALAAAWHYRNSHTEDNRHSERYSIEEILHVRHP